MASKVTEKAINRLTEQLVCTASREAVDIIERKLEVLQNLRDGAK
jgi:hypothetical protein